ncbi:hypothetical protein Nepgr_013952 [Nepenthes gracilis]|uniref:Transcription initiation factor IIA subunit 2 n=1 Tax=Nepenthes gracilis TaxID=150966 RepID=A0AAD3SK37_NEPGR|nr:hypothetical protein Nepgr_013952 [Nepenthes gracilis]
MPLERCLGGQHSTSLRPKRHLNGDYAISNSSELGIKAPILAAQIHELKTQQTNNSSLTRATAGLNQRFHRDFNPFICRILNFNLGSLQIGAMATFELYRRSTIGMCLTETLNEMVESGTLSPELAIQVLVQFDKSMTEALDNQVKSKVSIKAHLHTYRFCDNVWTFILQDAQFKNEESQETVGRVKIVACDSKLLAQ